MKRGLRKILKIIGYIIGGIITLVLVLLLLIQIPAVQNFIKDEAVSFIEGKINTPVRIDNLEIGFPKKIILSGFYFEDQNQDTLVAGERLAVNINFYKLLSNTVDIASIELEGAVANISRDRDSVFNFDYIIEAFATEEPQDTTATAMEISINTVDLDRIRFNMKDAISASDLNVNLQHFDTRIGTFDLENMNFEIPEINIDGLTVQMHQGIVDPSTVPSNPPAQEVTNDEAPLNIMLRDIAFTQININYIDEGTGMNSSLSLDELIAEIDELQLEEEYAEIASLELNGLNGDLLFRQMEGVSAEIPGDTISEPEASNNWRIKLNQGNVNDLAFRFKDENAPAVPQGIDYMDMDLTQVNLDINDLYYSMDSISGSINSFTLQDHSGLEIRSLETDFMYAATGAYLRDLYLETPHTILRDRVEASYTSLESLENELGELQINANLINSELGFQDILLFVPDLRDTNPFSSNPTAVLNINGAVNGKINNLSIENFEVDGIGSTILALDGDIQGLPDTENARYTINIRRFQATASDINQFVPPGTIPDSIILPERFSATGSFNGTAENFATRLNLQSSSGDAFIDARIDMRTENAERYVASVSLDEFDLGRLISNDSIGSLSLNFEVDGTSFDPAVANATASGAIEKMVYNNYTYRDLQLEGSIADGIFNADASMEDPNLNFDLNASGDFRGEYPSIQMVANLRNVALDSLNLYGSPLRFEGEITADLETADPDHLNGEIFFTNFIAVNATQTFALDSIAIYSTASPEVDSLVIRSQVLNATMKGDYQLTKIGPALSQSIARYYDATIPADTLGSPIQQDTIAPQRFTFTVNIDNDPVFNQLLPELDLVQPINITGLYNSNNDTIQLNMNIPRVRYLDYRLVNTSLEIETVEEAITYELIIDDLESPQLQLFHTEIAGEIADNIISYQLKIDDSAGEPHYRVAGTMETEDGSNRYALEIDNLMLNYDIWTIPEDNSITMGPAGIQATNFELSHDNNAIRINSQTEDPSSPIDVVFDSFRLETVSAMVSKDTLLAGGTLNGEVVLRNLTTAPEFNSDLTIENFSFKQDTVGNVQIRVDNETANSLNANVTISGMGNDVELAGIYGTQEGSLDFNLDIRHLNMESIQGFSFGAINESTGHLSGNLRIEGTAEDPAILGDLDFNQIGFRVTMINSLFQNMNDQISFTGEGIRFNNFTISDEENNELAVNGLVRTTDYTSYGFDLTVEADNFRAINSSETDNDFVYGVLILDTRLSIGGNMDNPRVRGSLSINEGTELSVVLPQDDPSIAEREGVVEFVDDKSRRMAQMQEIEETVNTSELQGMDVAVDITVNEEAIFTIIVDQGNGDFLRLQGEAQLTAGVDPSGRTNLTGRYDFTEGAYEMSFNFIRRRFDIEEGSFIQWTGEPTDATIDITAIYETETAPLDLLGNQLANMTQAQRNTYKQDLPFQTILRMTGELLEPVLAFDIRLPQRNYSVSPDIITNSRAKLAQLRQQPSELNKQVFALLLLNRFIGENPFSSEAGGMSAETMARQSVSKILSQQLNDLAGDLISGVQLEFDLESTEDYTTGQQEQRTDLNVGLSKTLMDDRLKVTVGSSFGLEGPQQTNQQANTIAGDIAVDYQLSKDGRYMLRAYRRNLYEVALQGQIIETGVAFIITMDYNKFMEIFGKDPKDN